MPVMLGHPKKQAGQVPLRFHGGRRIRLAVPQLRMERIDR